MIICVWWSELEAGQSWWRRLRDRDKWRRYVVPIRQGEDWRLLPTDWNFVGTIGLHAKPRCMARGWLSVPIWATTIFQLVLVVARICPPFFFFIIILNTRFLCHEERGEQQKSVTTYEVCNNILWLTGTWAVVASLPCSSNISPKYCRK